MSSTSPGLMPVTVIGGYLGCGKTTLVNHLLRHSNGTRLAVLVNDFGALPIDADLIESQDGDVISLAGGCICCSYGNDLGEALLDLQAGSTPIDQVLIESSGVALPGAIGSSLSLLRGFSLHCIAVVADVETICQHAADKYLADTIERQLTDADLILLNKLDLLDSEDALRVEDWICEQNVEARVLATVQSVINPAIILDSAWRTSENTTLNSNAAIPANRPVKPASAHVHGPAVFDAFELPLSRSYNAQKLASILADPASGLVRAKGFVPVAEGGLVTVQVVGRRWTVVTAPAGATSGLVCIGKRGEISEQSVTERLSQAAL